MANQQAKLAVKHAFKMTTTSLLKMCVFNMENLLACKLSVWVLGNSTKYQLGEVSFHKYFARLCNPYLLHLNFDALPHTHTHTQIH